MNTDENIIRDNDFEYESTISNPLLPPEIPDDYEPEIPQEEDFLQKNKVREQEQQLKTDKATHEKKSRQRKKELQDQLRRNDATIAYINKIARDARIKNLD